jgi:AraC family transcriptional regulator of adaptative response / DNA-3-methyladenine glycosylase II
VEDVGVTYSAVVTTGIYCRPSCSARPHPHNVVAYETAAAAEADGFRACLRCRPYRAVEPVRSDAPELVCRAVQLVLAGALDGGSEDMLARRLAVSARHLRRMFATHLGATPDQLARSRRAHFARRLLDDTDLTITDIAFASGFGSVRQLNRTCRDVFRATPRELRARRRAADRLVADGGLALRLPVAGPFDFDAMLSWFGPRAIAGVESVIDGVYRRTVVIDGDPGVLEVARGDGEHLWLRVHLPHWEGLIHVVERARRIFDLDLDVERATQGLASDPVIAPLAAARPGLRVPGCWDAFETGVRAIVGQQISVRAATTITNRIVARHGTAVAGLDAFGLSHTFPTAAALAGADLGGLGLTGARIDTIKRFAGAVAGDEIRFDGSVSLDELVASICAVRGLGPWTAHYLALRIGERDAFPDSDLDLRRAVVPGTTLSPKDVAAVAEAWRPWRALAAMHLWLRPRPQEAADVGGEARRVEPVRNLVVLG